MSTSQRVSVDHYTVRVTNWLGPELLLAALFVDFCHHSFSSFECLVSRVFPSLVDAKNMRVRRRFHLSLLLDEPFNDINFQWSLGAFTSTFSSIIFLSSNYSNSSAIKNTWKCSISSNIISHGRYVVIESPGSASIAIHETLFRLPTFVGQETLKKTSQNHHRTNEKSVSDDYKALSQWKLNFHRFFSPRVAIISIEPIFELARERALLCMQ